MNIFFSPSPIFIDKGIAVMRIIVGALLIYHGIEVFSPEIMKGYLDWDMFKGSSGKLKVYVGKSSEFIAGILLFLGLLTRPCAILIIGTFSYITFFVGQGRFWYQEQHPFMFVLFGLLFLFTGPGAWSVDEILFKKKI
jgi:putative oxidoreductase